MEQTQKQNHPMVKLLIVLWMISVPLLGISSLFDFKLLHDVSAQVFAWTTMLLTAVVFFR